MWRWIVSMWPASLFLATGCACFVAAGDKPQVTLRLKQVAFRVGESKLLAQERRFGRGGLTLVNLHDDEQASVEAAVQVLQDRGGRLVELMHSGKRRVEFSWQGKNYHFDPNRIFSPAGVRLTLRGDEPIPEGAYAAVETFAKDFIDYFRLDKQSVLIALHNNDEGSFSIRSYEPGAVYQADTARLHLEPGADPDDFCFVTEERVFLELQRRKMNVVLQDNTIRRDDGSLSVFSGRKSISYINVEAEPEHLQEQKRMLETAIEILQEL